MSRALEPVCGLLRACTDDIGAVLRALEHLILAAPVFKDVEEAAGLAFHLGKGAAVAHRAPRSAAACARRSGLSGVPGCSVGARYLAFEMGSARAAASSCGRPQIQIGSAAVARSPSQACRFALRPRGTTVLRWRYCRTRHCLRRRPSRAVWRLSGNKMSRLMHLLGNSIPRRALQDLPSHSAPWMLGVESVVRALGAWGAQQVLTDVAGLFNTLEPAVEQFGFLAGLVAPNLGPCGWGTEAMASQATRGGRRLQAQWSNIAERFCLHGS